MFLLFPQQLSGADLGILLIDVLEKSEEEDFGLWSSKLAKIFGLIRPTTPERDTFLAHAIRWSSKDTGHGHPLLHKVHTFCEILCRNWYV